MKSVGFSGPRCCSIVREKFLFLFNGALGATGFREPDLSLTLPLGPVQASRCSG